MRPTLCVLVISLAACSGPPALDAEVCRDEVHRLCIAPVCAEFLAQAPAAATDCEKTLLANTGCGVDTFTFSTPDRARFLSCRLPLLRLSGNPEAKPSCDDVAELIDRCPDVVRFLKGVK